MRPQETVDMSPKAATVPRRRPSILRSVFVLIIATAALFVFILVQGDMRRRRVALEQARWHADTLAARVGETGALPLNLDLAPAPERKGRMYRIESLSRDDARQLRKSGERVIVARTVSLPRVFAPDGRAVVFFEKGHFSVEWLTLPEFDVLYARQQEEIRRLAASGEGDSPNG